MDTFFDRVVAMQNAELFRRGIVVPCNSEAEELLRVNDVNEETPVRYLEIPDQSFFETLWALELFQGINTRSGSLIDDYEEEFIETGAIDSILESVDEVKSKKDAQNMEVQSFLSELFSLALESQKLQRPILFVL